MKLRKRRISILLSMLLLLSVFQPAAALDVAELKCLQPYIATISHTLKINAGLTRL